MNKNRFFHERTCADHPKWKDCIRRKGGMYTRENDIRNDFVRDYNRILHSTAYRRLKHKTQVFFATGNDHICTRIEHVNHVASVSYTICDFLGLSTELANAIAIGHDLGHAPFGHSGETILKDLIEKETVESFWHEKNSLRFIDSVETLQNPDGKEQNLNLTYAVRDGIICHCGEIKAEPLFPRTEPVELEAMARPNQYNPFTWEGCVVKIADKIAYLGRDIEDAYQLNILSEGQLMELRNAIRETLGIELARINNTVIIHGFIIDLCESSSPEEGIKLSDNSLELIEYVKNFNYKHIYRHKRLGTYQKYARLVLESIFETLREYFTGTKTMERLCAEKEQYPLLLGGFIGWLWKYSDTNPRNGPENRYENQVIYLLEDRNDYIRAIMDYISGMTDSFALKVFHELTSFERGRMDCSN